MENDSLTIEERRNLPGIAGQITKYGCTTLRTDKIESYKSALYDQFGITVTAEERSHLPTGTYLLKFILGYGC